MASGPFARIARGIQQLLPYASYLETWLVVGEIVSGLNFQWRIPVFELFQAFSAAFQLQPCVHVRHAVYQRSALPNVVNRRWVISLI